MANNDEMSDQLLNFQEFTHISNQGRDGSARIDVEPLHTNLGKSNMNVDPLTDLMDELAGSKMFEDKLSPLKEPSSTSHSFLSLGYYQKFFDVDTMEVVERIATSMIPRRASPNYLISTIEAKPDLYGPFWIVITLIFTIAISGNLSAYLQHASTNYHWRYDFHLVSYAATAIVCYAVFVPVALWASLKWTARLADPEGIEDNTMPGMLTLLCVYGYSLAIYVPVSIMWSIQVSLLQWLLVLTAAFLSGSVLVLTIGPSLRKTNQPLLITTVLLFLHFLLAAGFMLYFFHVPKSINITTPTENHDALKITTTKSI